MNQQHFFHSTNRLLSMVLLLSLWFSLFSINGLSIAKAEQPKIDSLTPTTEDEIKLAILNTISAHDNVIGFIVFDIVVDNVKISLDGKWATARLYYIDKTSSEKVPSEPGFALGEKIGNDWKITLQVDESWDLVLGDIPSDLLDDQEKSFWHVEESLRLATAQSFGGYKLPWAGGQSHALYRSISHPSPEEYAFDFGENGNQFELWASKGGVVWFAQWNYPDGYDDGNCNHANYIVIKDATTSPETYVIYLHLKQDSIPTNLRTRGAVVVQGQMIGIADDTGCSTASHVHIQVHTNPDSWYGSSQDMTFDDVSINGGRPRTPTEASAYGGQGQTWYISGNYRSCNNPNPGSDQIGLYSDDNYCGTAKILVVGDYSNPSNMGFPNDSLSSIKVGSNVKATLCKDDNYAGGCEDFTGDDSHLGDNGIGNDTVSSVKVAFRNNCSPNADQVAFYMDPNFSGPCVVKGIGNYPDPGSMGIANDSLSSVKVGNNVKVTLYVDSNYSNTSEAFTGDDTDLSNNTIGNDSASSAIVETRKNILPADYGYCAEEGQTCAFSGTAQIYYGANDQFVGPVTKTDGVACSNDIFGDPIPGTHKQCFIKGGQPQGSTYCATEGSTCSFGSTNVATVYYGVNGQYNTQTGVVSSIACTNDVFGDPFSGIGKACYYIITGSSISTPSNPSPSDNTAFSRTNNTVLSWNTNGTICTVHIWGGNIDISPSNNCSSLQLGEQRGGAYNWQVTANNGSGSATGPIWHFNIKPYAPTNLISSNVSASQVTLNWTLSSDEPADIDTYEIYQDGQYIGYVTKGISSYTVSGLTCDGSYSFYVKSKRQGVLSDASNTVNRGTVGCVPAVPGNVTMSNATLHSLTLSWQDNSNNETGFNIYRWGYDGASWDFYYFDSVGMNVTSYTQTGLVCGSDFNFYEVSAYNTIGESPHTFWIQGATSPCPDLAPNPRPGRTDPVIVSSVSGTTTNDTLYVGEPAYFDWGFTNLGNADVNGSYYVDLYIDDQRFVHYPYTWLGVGADGGFDDWSETWNQSGWHTVKLVVDPDNTVDESNEGNNVWTKDFYWNSYDLNVSKAGTGSGTVTSNPAGINCGSDCSESYSYNTLVTLTATPIAGSTFAGWSGDADCSDGQVTMNVSKSCVATFNIIPNYTLTVTRTGFGSGTVASDPAGINCGPNCSYVFPLNTSVSLTATPATGSAFYGWSGACTGSHGCVIAMTDVQSVTANFSKPGDANDDGKVDILDYSIWSNHYGEQTSNGSADGDFNNDGIVDGVDYAIWLDNTTVTYTISGNTGAAGATLSYTDGTAKSATSQTDGSYSFTVSYGWSGTVTPTHTCYTFTPTARSYSNVTTNQTAQNYTATFNPSSGCANINVTIGGAPQGSYGVHPGEEQRLYYDVSGGPVVVHNTNSFDLVSAIRLQSKPGPTLYNFVETMGVPDGLLSYKYYFPTYNNTWAPLNSQLRFANINNTAITVRVTIGTQHWDYSVAANSERREYLPVSAGPVIIESLDPTKDIIAAIRLQSKPGATLYSFSETMGIPVEQLSDTYYFPTYNNTWAPLNSQLRFGVP